MIVLTRDAIVRLHFDEEASTTTIVTVFGGFCITPESVGNPRSLWEWYQVSTVCSI